jgi:protein Mpv17
MTVLWTVYLRCLNNRPLLTKSLTASALCGVGDVLVQSFASKERGAVDVKRTLRLMAHGLIATGPLNHYWHTRVLERVFPTSVAAGRAALDAAIGKVVLDQAIFAPCIITIFCTNMAVMQGKPADANWPKVLPLIVSNWAFWPAFQLVNFRFVPIQHQVGFVGFGMILWSAYISWFEHDREREKLKI